MPPAISSWADLQSGQVLPPKEWALNPVSKQLVTPMTLVPLLDR